MANIVYAGTIYNKQDTSRLLRALRELRDEGEVDSTLQFHFYGETNQRLAKEIGLYHLEDSVFQHGLITHGKMLEIERNADILLVLNWEDENDKGVIPGKFFEYMPLGRPIIITGGYPCELTRILSETRTGIYVQTFGEIKQALLGISIEYRGKENNV